MAWTLRDTWSGSFDLPSSTGRGDRGSDKAETTVRSQTEAQAARGSLAGLFSGDDYPADAQRNDEQGTVEVALEIDRRGRVSGCEVIQSSGSQSLDSATCNILQRRARFTPAKDGLGRPVTDTYTQRITWRLEG
ncbi:MAG: energy transducer TonB [Sphingomonas sp.]|nr:energy transducer TonB [Sphingomonas sp.]